jgi:hypothetical protein
LLLNPVLDTNCSGQPYPRLSEVFEIQNNGAEIEDPQSAVKLWLYPGFCSKFENRQRAT